jgi:hypothetical protein
LRLRRAARGRGRGRPGGSRLDDLYLILEVAPHADQQAIQASYRRLAKRYHPDRNPERAAWAEEQMKRVNAAYAILSDRARRRVYDDRKYNTPHSAPRPAPYPYNPSVRKSRPAYPAETENDWFYMHVYAEGRTVPDVERTAETRMQTDMAEFMRLVAPPDAGDIALVDLLRSAATVQYVAYSAYGQLVARVTLRTVLPLIRAAMQSGAVNADRLRRIVVQVNDLIQDRMGTERLHMVMNGKNIVADWTGLLLTVVNFLWGDDNASHITV